MHIRCLNNNKKKDILYLYIIGVAYDHTLSKYYNYQLPLHQVEFLRHSFPFITRVKNFINFFFTISGCSITKIKTLFNYHFKVYHQYIKRKNCHNHIFIILIVVQCALFVIIKIISINNIYHDRAQLV